MRQYDVLIIGAGPSGLTLANVLAREGVSFAILDKKNMPAKQSRAAIVHVRTLELLHKLGLAEPLIAQGLKIRDVNVYAKGREVASFALVGKEAATLTPFPFAISIEQYKTEELLAEGLRRAGGDITWQTELVALEKGDSGYQAVIRHANGHKNTVAAQWIVAADGASSLCRQALGLDFEGKTYELTGFLADVSIDPATKPEPGAIHLNLARGGFVGMLGLSNGLYRLFGAVPPEFSNQNQDSNISHEAYASVPLETIQHWFDTYFSLKAKLTGAEWSSLFRIHSRLASHFQQDNVFLIGDAAHIHSPAGGQGMNLGIGDACNLGWKLAAVVQGNASEQLLSSYEEERHAIAKTVLHNTDRGFMLEATKNPVADWVKTHIVPSVLGPVMHRRAVQRTIFKLFSQTWIQYHTSSIVGGEATAKVKPGDRAPHGIMNKKPIYDAFVHNGHTLLIFEGAKKLSQDSVRFFRQLAQESRLPVNIHVIPISERALYETYGVRKACYVLVRPDEYVGYIGKISQPDKIRAYFAALYGSSIIEKP
jgi:2-polyprenyl-6-methoxyphenol hydroxylase-like FAD-dependent oxidoreductase